MRRFLLLQGPIGPFFRELARELVTQGHAVERILFNGGDALYWSGPAIHYGGTITHWPAFLARELESRGITDIVLFGDCRPLHREAIALARERNIPVHVFEEGYFRPHWLTLESGGVNGYSRLPREPGWYVERAETAPQAVPDAPVADTPGRRAWISIVYTLATLLLGWRYRGYRTHRPWHPIMEYAGGLLRMLIKPVYRVRSGLLATQAITDGRPYYLLPLQLEADSQIRFHFSGGSLKPAIERVVQSFAKHAPADRLLIVTEHPLDGGMVDLGRVTRSAARAAGVSERVVFLRGGSGDWLTSHCRGLVTVNSTIGYRALSLGVPVKALGWALYDMPGLTFQRDLDQFWEDAAAPDASLFEAFRRVVIARAQVNGTLYGGPGLVLAARNAAQRLIAPQAGLRAVASRKVAS